MVGLCFLRIRILSTIQNITTCVGRGGWEKERVHVHYQLYRLAYLVATESRQTDWGAHINNKWYNEDHNGYPEVFVSW